MQRKPVVLILTSSREYGNAAENVAAVIRALGTHNAVVLGEDKYGVGVSLGKAGAFLSERDEHGLPVGERVSSKGSVRGRGFRRGPLAARRNTRIANAVKRYAPDLVLTLTPYAQAAFSEAKRRKNFSVPGVHVVTSFVLPNANFTADAADAYIVENADVKAALVKRGIPPRSVMIMGLPYDSRRITPIEMEDGKQELGLPRTPTVFVNADGKKDAVELLGLLVDQGNIINVACCAADIKRLAALRAKADGAETRSNVAIVTRRELFDEYMLMSDIVVTRYDPSLIYKCFKAGKPVVAYGKTSEERKNLEYLAERKLIMLAHSDIDVVALIYKLMQTDTAAEFVANGLERTEMSTLENTVGYLTSFVGG